MEETDAAWFCLSPELWASFGNHGAVPQLFTPNASSSLSTDQCCLWASSCSGGFCLPEKMDGEIGTDWCMFSFASDMKKMMALLSVATMEFLLYLMLGLLPFSAQCHYLKNTWKINPHEMLEAQGWCRELWGMRKRRKLYAIGERAGLSSCYCTFSAYQRIMLFLFLLLDLFFVSLFLTTLKSVCFKSSAWF